MEVKTFMLSFSFTTTVLLFLSCVTAAFLTLLRNSVG